MKKVIQYWRRILTSIVAAVLLFSCIAPNEIKTPVPTLEETLKLPLPDSSFTKDRWYILSYLIYPNGETEVPKEFPQILNRDSINRKPMANYSTPLPEFDYVDFSKPDKENLVLIVYDNGYGFERSWALEGDTFYMGHSSDDAKRITNNGSAHALFQGVYVIKQRSPVYIKMECTSNFAKGTLPSTETVEIVRKEYYDLLNASKKTTNYE